MLKRRVWLPAFFLFFLFAQSATAEHRFIVRTSLGLSGLQQTCLLHLCNVVRSLDGSFHQIFLVTTSDPLSPNVFLSTLRLLPGIVDAEIDQVLVIGTGVATLLAPPPGLSDSSLIGFYGSPVWNGYVVQPAAQIVRISDAQNYFSATGAGVVADIDTGVDPTHPALASILLPGYDFTRNQSGGSELTDWPYPDPPPCSGCEPAFVNQSTAAVLDQSTAAVLDGTPYAAFGHGTMVSGVIHLTAPTAFILPLKAFQANGTGYLSDILRAVYFAVQNQANIINMSFDFTSPSVEMQTAINYANQNGVTCVASVGNDGQQIVTYPASLPTVMGVASTSNVDTRSAFSNYGSEVWVAAPGESIISTYPFGTYAASSGTSFSSPFVAGGVALLRNLNPGIAPSDAAQAIAHAKQLTPDLGNGRLDLYLALGSLQH